MSKSSALARLNQTLAMKNPTAFMPGYIGGKPTPTNVSGYISRIQFTRLAHDIGMWREAVVEAENAYYPQRVRMQRMFIDTVENGFVKAAVERYKELTLLRDYEVYQMKGARKEVSEVLTQQLSAQAWVKYYIEYTIEALLFGYNNIELGDVVNDGFPNITFTRRENLRPDGVSLSDGRNSGPILTSLIYAVDGLRLENDDPLIPLFNHWVPTKTNVGLSVCGYGLLYNIALYEIHLRHLVEWNMDYVEMFGMPTKVGKTLKQGAERKQFEQFLFSTGSNSAILLDKNLDEIEFVQQNNAGTGWKSYGDARNYMQGVISQLLLGHTDAMISLPGKLGGMQAANADGFNESLIEQAMNDKQTTTGNFVIDNMNAQFAPKMRLIGDMIGSKLLKNLIPEGYYFGLRNDKEEEERKRRTNSSTLIAAQWAKTAFDAGMAVDINQFNAHTGFVFKPVDVASAPTGGNTPPPNTDKTENTVTNKFNDAVI